ncbi:MAG: hypothetical protein AAF514_07625, partial [Verrucomicrobiota bacterium]
DATLISFLSGRLPETEISILEAHLRVCESCCERVDHLEELQRDGSWITPPTDDQERGFDSPEDAVVKRLGGYLVKEKVGQRGMAVVYRGGR